MVIFAIKEGGPSRKVLLLEYSETKNWNFWATMGGLQNNITDQLLAMKCFTCKMSLDINCSSLSLSLQLINGPQNPFKC